MAGCRDFQTESVSEGSSVNQEEPPVRMSPADPTSGESEKLWYDIRVRLHSHASEDHNTIRTGTPLPQASINGKMDLIGRLEG